MNTIITNDITLELGPAEAPSEVSTEPFAREALWICREHDDLTHDHLVAVARSAAIGEVLSRIKAALGHGKWTPWTKRNLPGISARTIRRYMEIFHRYREPPACEDPAAFLAGIYGNVELPASTILVAMLRRDRPIVRVRSGGDRGSVVGEEPTAPPALPRRKIFLPGHPAVI